MENYKLLAIIPAFNEENSISDVIKSVKDSMPSCDIVVVNDGSKDKTAEVAKNEGIIVLDLPYNLGIGGAMQTGYLYAKKNNYAFAVQIDGDGQHNPKYLKNILEPVLNNSCDMCIGSRYCNVVSTEDSILSKFPSSYHPRYKSTISRRMGMLFFSGLIKLLTGKKITDTTSGFRVVNKEVINLFANKYPTDYPEVEVIVELHRKKFRICEVPVEMKNRQNGSSSITPIYSILYLVKVSLALFINSIRKGELR